MPVFRFKFEPVLKHRQIVEDQRQRELAAILRQRVAIQEELRQMQETIVQSKRSLADSLVGKVNVDQISQFARFSSQVTMRAQQMVVRLAGIEKQIDLARARLLKATQARKAMELLRDKHHRQFVREQDLKEAAVLDELATQQYARQLMIGVPS